MSSEIAGLMHAIHDLPHDDLPRLAFADWCEEHGQADRAEFIRVQIALARVDHADEDRYRPLHDREVALITEHKDEWFGPFRSEWRWYDCKRGFIDEVWGPVERFLEVADWFHEHHALQQVRLSGVLDDLAGVLRCSPLPVLRSLTFQTQLSLGSTLGDRANCAEPLERRPLDLGFNGFRAGADLIELLTAHRLPERLASLDLSNNHFTAEALQGLLAALPTCPRLVRLNLSSSFTEGQGVARLARHPAVAQLKEIDLSNNCVMSEEIRALVDSPYLHGVTRLVLRESAGVIRERYVELLRERFGERVVLSQG